jgi:hypothetical protein
MTFEFSWQYFEKIQISNFIKIRLVGTKVSHTDRHGEANDRFS